MSSREPSTGFPDEGGHQRRGAAERLKGGAHGWRAGGAKTRAVG